MVEKKNVLLCFVKIVNFSGVHLALIKTYFMDVFNMTYVKNTTVYKLKNQQKSPCVQR